MRHLLTVTGARGAIVLMQYAWVNIKAVLLYCISIIIIIMKLPYSTLLLVRGKRSKSNIRVHSKVTILFEEYTGGLFLSEPCTPLLVDL